jgi:hypothetical protein
MKQKLIIMTTAITRPTLHNQSIGNFYLKYYFPYKNDIDEYFDLYHVINIDWPDKLKQYFTVEDTINNFNEIIPETVTKIYNTPENPSFLQAFKNIMYKIEEHNLLSLDNWYWWFEDDWIGTNNLNFFQIIKFIKNFKNSALTMTRNCQIGSFRGGPIMNGFYFLNYFNIERLGYMNNTCDPERQVSRFIGAKNVIEFPNSLSKKRELINEYDKQINLLLIYFDPNISRISPDFSFGFYKEKFNKEIFFKHHICIINNYDINEILYLNFDLNNDLNNINSYKNFNLNELTQIFFSDSITYIIIKPYCFEDCGRDFASSYNLIKGWQKIGDKITYS